MSFFSSSMSFLLSFLCSLKYDTSGATRPPNMRSRNPWLSVATHSLCVRTAAAAGGPISGGAFNPAVGVGMTAVNALIGKGSWEFAWIYLAGPVVGGIVAAL